MMLDLNDTQNLLVRAMSASDRAILAPHFTKISLRRDEVIASPGEPVKHVYFLEEGFITVGTADAGRQTEIGILGREALLGSNVALGSSSMPFVATTQSAGSSALRIHVNHLETAVAQSPTLKTLLLHFCLTFMTQVAITAVANVRCDLETRIGRWLLMCHDRIDGDLVPLTHELVARMVGAHRTAVTQTMHLLEKSGSVRAARGCILIRDRAKLLELVSGTYGQAEAEYSRFIAPFGEH